MNRDRLAVVGVALLAVFALSAAAATMGNTDETGGSGIGSGSESGAGGGGDDLSLGSLNATSDAPSASVPRLLLQVLMAIALLASVVAFYDFYREHGLRGLAKLAGVVLVVAAGMVLLLYGLTALSIGDSAGGLFGGGEPSAPAGGADGEGGEGATTALAPPIVLVALLGLVVVGAAVAVASLADEDVPDSPGEPSEASATEVSAVGRAAGRAADRIAGDADVTNEVYRAWREMTDHLDVDNPAAATPAEFADAATDAGMAGEDVAELTRLFESVRYGDQPATADRERRAVAALRRIERTYAPGGRE